MHRLSISYVVYLMLLFGTGLNAAEPKKVLIIGDSISFGYLNVVKEQLKGVAVVTHNKGNARFTTYGMKKIDQWVGATKWDLIQFNFGLWDMYGWSQKPMLTVEQYEKQLDAIATQLKKTGAPLIFAGTTPVCPAPEVTAKIIVSKDKEKQFNEAAARVMKKHGIPINDLHAVISVDRKKYAKGDNDVHYNGEGRRVLGTQVARMIKKVLAGVATGQ